VFLLDTNVVSELRKGERANPGVRAWFVALPAADAFLSVLTVGEIREGVERLRRRDPGAAQALEQWLTGLVRHYADRILPVDAPVADRWGRLRARRSLPVIDSLLAATARQHHLTITTRNERDFARLDVDVLNPFSS
jgi:predicted nucleic acid-binding protein